MAIGLVGKTEKGVEVGLGLVFWGDKCFRFHRFCNFFCWLEGDKIGSLSSIFNKKLGFRDVKGKFWV